MWKFLQKKPAPSVRLTNDAFTRWLRAHSPQPLEFFLGLTDAEQSALAEIGDEYLEDRAIAYGFAIKDPDAAAFGASGGDPEEVEEILAAKLGRMASQAPAPREAPTMGGLSERRTQAEHGRATERNEGRRLLGKAPTPPAGVEV